MAILLLDIETDDRDEDFELLVNYFDTMIEQHGTNHYRIFKVHGLNVPKDNTEINPTFFELSNGRLAIGHING